MDEAIVIPDPVIVLAVVVAVPVVHAVAVAVFSGPCEPRNCQTNR